MDNDREKIIQESLDNEIPTNVGLAAYRKYLWAIKYLEEEEAEIKAYKESVVRDIDHKLSSIGTQKDKLRSMIEHALENDPKAKKTKSGGKSINLPDIGNASLTGFKESYEYTDEEALMKHMGEEFVVTKQQLDKIKLKNWLKKNTVISKTENDDGTYRVVNQETGEVVDGIVVRPTRSFRLSLK